MALPPENVCDWLCGLMDQSGMYADVCLYSWHSIKIDITHTHTHTGFFLDNKRQRIKSTFLNSRTQLLVEEDDLHTIRQGRKVGKGQPLHLRHVDKLSGNFVMRAVVKQLCSKSGSSIFQCTKPDNHQVTQRSHKTTQLWHKKAYFWSPKQWRG